MKIVIDSNILFSILVKADGKTAELFFRLSQLHKLYMCDVSFDELHKHQAKLKKLSGLSYINFEKLKSKIFNHLSIIPSALFSSEVITEAYKLVKDIDTDDLPIVGAAIFINGILLTGDKPLVEGARKQSVDWIYDSREIETLLLT